ncbi:DUF2333 domain-containing protein, partial [Rhizobium phaseoli]
MLDRIAGFFRLIGRTIGRWARLFFAWAFWPFLAAHGWYQRRSWMIRLPIIALVALFVVLYGYFFWQTQVWTNFN